MFLSLRSRASATLNLAVPVPPGPRHTGKTQRYRRRTITISLLCRVSSTSSSGRTLLSLSALRLVLRWARSIPYQMATEAISSLVHVMKHPHDIGHCSRFDGEGVPVVRWIEVVSGQCVYGNLGAVSWIFGTLSPSGRGVLHFRLLFYLIMVMRSTPSNHFELSKWLRRWTLADFPHKLVHGSPDISLRLNVGTDPIPEQGDITNFLGCVLTRQLPFQTLLACYYVLVDSVLMFQFLFYKILFPPRPQALIPPIGSNSHHSQLHHGTMTPQPHSTSAPVPIHRIKAIDRDFQRGVISIAVLLGLVSLVAGEPPPDPPNDTADSMEFIGRVFAWICCGFYLSSRIPQILENHRRKSTQGINIALFTFALCGNLFYTMGILTNPLAHDPFERREFLLNAFPYLLGSAGYAFVFRMS